MGVDWKVGPSLSYIDKLTGSNSLSAYTPRLPKEIPALNIAIRCPESIIQELSEALEGVIIHSSQHQEFHSIHEHDSLLNGESVINY